MPTGVSRDICTQRPIFTSDGRIGARRQDATRAPSTTETVPGRSVDIEIVTTQEATAAAQMHIEGTTAPCVR